MRKLNDEQTGRIMNILNKGYGDSWNHNYGIFRPMKEWKAIDWLQYVVVSIVFVLGILKTNEICDNFVNNLKLKEFRAKANVNNEFYDMDTDDEEDEE